MQHWFFELFILLLLDSSSGSISSFKLTGGFELSNISIKFLPIFVNKSWIPTNILNSKYKWAWNNWSSNIH